ncbi:MAG: hypothetical protein DMG68_06050 [Acidobacteria bacterium]|nr:MAG: hypothetical protein DMG68_06050 [Acidobacteriota bacterium]
MLVAILSEAGTQGKPESHQRFRKTEKSYAGRNVPEKFSRDGLVPKSELEHTGLLVMAVGTKLTLSR